MIRYCPPVPPIYKRSKFRFKQPYSYYKKYITFNIFRPSCETYFEACLFPSMTILPLYLSMFITFCSCQSSFTIPLILEQVSGYHFSKIYFSSCNNDCKRNVAIPFYELPHDIQLTILTIVNPFYPYLYTNNFCAPCSENFKVWMYVSASAQVDFGFYAGPSWTKFGVYFTFFCLSKYYQPCDPFKNATGFLPPSFHTSTWAFLGHRTLCFWDYYDCFFREYFPSTDLYVQKIYDVYNHRLIVEVST
jgi:hypothetical protein